LVTICKDLGKKEYYEYSKQLKKLERAQDARIRYVRQISPGYADDYGMGPMPNTPNQEGNPNAQPNNQYDPQQPIQPTMQQNKRFIVPKEEREDD
jgi:hypothetical protein